MEKVVYCKRRTRLNQKLDRNLMGKAYIQEMEIGKAASIQNREEDGVKTS